MSNVSFCLQSTLNNLNKTKACERKRIQHEKLLCEHTVNNESFLPFDLFY